MDVREDANHNVFITLPNGRRVAFALTPVQMSPWFPFYQARFTAPPGVFDELEIADANRILVRSGGGWVWMFEGYFDPDTYILKTKEGFTYTIAQGVGVRRVEDTSGNYLEINENGIISSCGRDVVFNRDSQGRIVSMVDPEGNELTYTYDALGRVLTTTDPNGRTITYERNARGDRSTMTTPDGLVTTYDYDQAGRIQEITTGTDWVAFTYDGAGHIEWVDYSNGAVAEYTHDSFGQLTGVTIRDSSDTVISSYEYSLDENGMRTGVTMADGTASYTLGSLYRLTREDVDSASLGTYTEDYTYDEVGNRLDPGATHGPDNRLMTDAYGTYGYDGNGNVMSRGAETFGYDSNNRLVSYSDGTTTASYEYDYNGRRVSRTIDGDITEYVYDGQNIAAEYLNGTQVARYTHGLGMDKPLMVVRNNETFFYHTDGLGSVVAITDEAGQVVQRYGYDAWGNIVYNDGFLSRTIWIRKRSCRSITVLGINRLIGGTLPQNMWRTF